MVHEDIYLQLFISVLFSIMYFKRINYDFFSIRGITVIFFVMFYPFVISLVLFERWYYFDAVIQNADVIINTLYAYNVFIFIFYITEFFKFKRKHVLHKSYDVSINIKRVYLLVGFFMLAVLLRFVLGLYYHVSINPDYNVSAGSFQNLIDKLHWIGIIPIFILFFMYNKTKRKFYLFISLFLLISYVAIYLPSGSRTTAFSFVPVFLIYVVSSMKSRKSIIIFSATSFVLLAMLVIFSGKIRVDESNFENTGTKEDIAVLTHRLSDCLNTGRVIERVPSEYDFRYLNNMHTLFYTPFPHFMRVIIGMKANFNDGPEYAYKIGLTPYWTSVPITILGDFYSRLGWFGIVIFSLLLVTVLRWYDTILNKRSALFKIIFLTLFSRYASQIYVVDLQILFVNLTREFIVTFLLSLGVFYLIKKKRVTSQ